jgi:hypothetical protein
VKIKHWTRERELQALSDRCARGGQLRLHDHRLREIEHRWQNNPQSSDTLIRPYFDRLITAAAATHASVASIAAGETRFAFCARHFNLIDSHRKSRVVGIMRRRHAGHVSVLNSLHKHTHDAAFEIDERESERAHLQC